MCQLLTKEGPISFCLKRSSRKSVSVQIDEKARIQVGAPVFVAENRILSFLQEKESWILKKLKEVQKRNEILRRKRFADGHEFLFLGKKRKLKVTKTFEKRVSVNFNGQEWSVSVPEGLGGKQGEEEIRKELADWYKTQAKEILGGRVFHFSRILNIEPRTIVVRTQKRLWGSCHYHNKSIHLNWQIILAPPEVTDYVVVHELCHLFVPNHSKKFWQKVAKILPDFKKRRQWLKVNAAEMMLP